MAAASTPEAVLPDPSLWLGFGVALGCGLLIGIDRERRKGRGGDRAAAGLRSFTVAALTGAMAQALPVPGLVLAGAALVVLLAVVSHFKGKSGDPGLTTELALFATYLVGVQAMLAPALAAACGTGLAVLLAARERLHHFATQLLTDEELHDGLLLAALALIALPLVPPGPIAVLGGIEARPLVALVVLILALQAAAHVALRWLGPRGGLPLAGFLSGFVSSTATVATLGRRARGADEPVPLLAAAAGLSGAATWVLALTITTALAPSAAGTLLPLALAGAAGPLLVALPLLRQAADGAGVLPRERRALRPREAVITAALLAGVALLVSAVQRQFGDSALFAGVALAALADAHAAVAALASLVAAGQLQPPELVQGVLVTVGANTASRILVASLTGGLGYALRVGAALLLSLLLAGLAAALGAALR